MAQQVNDVDVSEIEARYGPLSVEEAFERDLKSSLSENQIDLLNKSPSKVFVCGPPGTGKTLLLKRQGVTWLKGGHDVHILSIFDASRAVSMCVFGQLKKVAASLETSSRPQVKLHSFNFELKIKNKDEESKAIETLSKEAIGKEQLCILIDEADFDGILEEFCTELNNRLPTKLCLCVAATRHTVRPSCLEEIKLTKSLRATQKIICKVKKADEISFGLVYNYTDLSNLPVGSRPKSIKHRYHQTYNQNPSNPEFCKECGSEVAIFINNLNRGPSSSQLHNRDIFILYSDKTEFLGVTNVNNFIQGLRENNIPARLVEIGDENVAAIKEIALMSTDDVIVTHCKNVQGLERKVVVVPERSCNFSVKEYELRWLSRCSEQLIILKCVQSSEDT